MALKSTRDARMTLSSPSRFQLGLMNRKKAWDSVGTRSSHGL